MSQTIASKGVVVARDGVIIWVWVFTSRIQGVTLDGCAVGAGSTWHWHGIATAWLIGGFAIISSRRTGQPCHWWVACNFVDAGFTDGGAHVWGRQVAKSERVVGDHSLGDLLLMSCSHHWSGLGGQA